MAFGFDRNSGKSRSYTFRGGDSNAPFEVGQTVSRRRYDAYVESLGKRTHMPGASAIRDTERQLEAMRADLAKRVDDVAAREMTVALREQELELEKQLFRKSRTSAGQRRYNTVLEAFVREKRRGGRKISKIEARKSPEFLEIMKDIKGKPNKKNNPNIRDQNRALRKRALDKLGGATIFREQYENMYGPADGGTFRGVDRTGRSFRVRRRVA